MTDLLVTGYPKSGNTHLARLLGNLFDSPVTGIQNAQPIAQEGLGRPGPHIVRQLHVLPNYDAHSHALLSAWDFAVQGWQDERVFWIVRDPRDVAVSMMHYWEIPSVLEALKNMTQQVHSKVRLSWIEHTEQWSDLYEDCMGVTEPKIVKVHYERLIRDPVTELVEMMNAVRLPFSPDAMMKSISLNRFETRRADIDKYGDDKSHYPAYHRGIQLQNLRKGVAGDWVNYFNREAAEYAEERFGRWMRKFGYTQDEMWVDRVHQ